MHIPPDARVEFRLQNLPEAFGVKRPPGRLTLCLSPPMPFSVTSSVTLCRPRPDNPSIAGAGKLRGTTRPGVKQILRISGGRAVVMHDEEIGNAVGVAQESQHDWIPAVLRLAGARVDDRMIGIIGRAIFKNISERPTLMVGSAVFICA